MNKVRLTCMQEMREKVFKCERLDTAVIAQKCVKSQENFCMISMST